MLRCLYRFLHSTENMFYHFLDWHDCSQCGSQILSQRWGGDINTAGLAKLYCVLCAMYVNCWEQTYILYCVETKHISTAGLRTSEVRQLTCCEHSRRVLILKINKKYLVVDFQKPIDTGAPEKCLEEWVTGGDWLAWIWQQSLSVLTCNNTIKQLNITHKCKKSITNTNIKMLKYM